MSKRVKLLILYIVLMLFAVDFAYLVTNIAGSIDRNLYQYANMRMLILALAITVGYVSLNKHLLQVLALLVCCVGVGCSAAPHSPRSLTVDSEAVAYQTSTIDLYHAAGYNAAVHRNMTILDADEQYILFALESKRTDNLNALGEGILAQTSSVGLFNQSSGEVTQVALPSTPSPTYVCQGVVDGDDLLLTSIALDGADNQYSVLHARGNTVSTIYASMTERHFLQWPQLVKLGDDIFLMEVGTDDQPPTFNKLTQGGLQQVPFSFPNDAKLVSNQYSSDGSKMVTLWGQGEQTLLVINDSNKVLETVALPHDDSVVDFALMQDGLAVSVKSRTTEKSHLRYTSFQYAQTDYYPCIEIYRMNGRLQQGQLMGLSSRFAPYLFKFGADGVVQSEIDISEWNENDTGGRVSIFTTSENTYLLNLHDKQNVVRIEVDD